MNRQEAAEKVAKLERLARGSSNPHEAAAARERAHKIAQEHGLSPAEIEVGTMGAAFDDLVDQVKKIVAQSPRVPAGLFDTRSLVDDVLNKIKGASDADKASRLKQIAGLIRTASFIAGNNKTVAEAKAALDTVLKNHELTI